MEKIIRLVFSTLVLMFVALPMNSCGDDAKDEPNYEDDPYVGDEFYSADVPTNPAKGNVGYEGGQLKFQVLYKDDKGKSLNPSALVGKDRDLYYNLHIRFCDIYDRITDKVLDYYSVTGFSEDGFVTFKGEDNLPKDLKVKKEIGDDGYLYFIVDVPENPWPDVTVFYYIEYSSIDEDDPLVLWRDVIGIYQSAK